MNKDKAMQDGFTHISTPPETSMKVEWVQEDGTIDYGFYNKAKNTFMCYDPVSDSPILYWKPMAIKGILIP